MSKIVDRIIKTKSEQSLISSLNKRKSILEQLIKKYKTNKEFRENQFLHGDIETNITEILFLFFILNKIDSTKYQKTLINNYFNNDILIDDYLKKMFKTIKPKLLKQL
jgi:glucose-6-phosphate-specific signal transduction histidine kinase